MEHLDISKGLDDVGLQPTDDEVTERLSNTYRDLAEIRRRQYASRQQPKRDAMVEELYASGVRFDEAREDAWAEI